MVPASPQLLARHELRPWVDIPHYIPDDDPEPGSYRVEATRAHSTDFAFRTIEQTVADEAATCPRVSPALAPRGRLSRARELGLAASLI